MHRTEITVFDDVPEEIARAVAPYVEKWAWLAPSWVRVLYVGNMTKASDGVVARIESSYRYRRAAIYVTPLWLEESPEERERYLLHEMCHLFTRPADEWVQLTLRRLVPDDSAVLHRELADHFEEFIEGCTVDLTAALWERECQGGQ